MVCVFFVCWISFGDMFVLCSNYYNVFMFVFLFCVFLSVLYVLRLFVFGCVLFCVVSSYCVCRELIVCYCVLFCVCLFVFVY